MTNKTISLTIPNDDPIALHEFGAAMQRMAHSHGHPVVVPHEVAKEIMTERKAAIREAMTHDTDKAQLAALGAETPHLTREEVEALVEDDTNDTGAVTEQPKTVEELRAWVKTNQSADTHLDSDGLPWDARIHATGKDEHGNVTHPRNADDTWRARRKPSDMDAGQWAEFQGQVRTELRALMELPVEQEVAAVLDDTLDTVVVYYINANDGVGYKHVVQGKSVKQAVIEVHEQFNGSLVTEIYLNDELQPLTAHVVLREQHTEVKLGEPKVASLTASGELSVGYVVEPVEPEPIVVTPPPVVAPPAPVEPPAPTGTAPTEFVPFLQWITSSGITPEQVNVALAQHGLTAVPQLQQRPDLIPQVHATLAAGV